MARKNLGKKALLMSLVAVSVFIFIACNNKTEEKIKLITNSGWNNAEIQVSTAWNNDKPGMYGVNKNFTPWEKIEEKGMLEIKNGKLYAQVWEEDPGSSASDITGILIIPNTVTSIEERTFDSCPALLKVIIPDSVKCVKNNAFAYCERLESVNIPDSVETIGRDAFNKVRHIEYHGKATYESDNKYWGALSMN